MANVLMLTKKQKTDKKLTNFENQNIQNVISIDINKRTVTYSASDCFQFFKIQIKKLLLNSTLRLTLQ